MARVLFTYSRQSSELSLIQIEKRPNERECLTAKLYSQRERSIFNFNGIFEVVSNSRLRVLLLALVPTGKRQLSR